MNNVEKAQDSYKSRMAQKWGIPVVSVDFIQRCVEAKKLLETDPYTVVGKTAAQEFSSGKILGRCWRIRGEQEEMFFNHKWQPPGSPPGKI